MLKSLVVVFFLLNLTESFRVIYAMDKPSKVGRFAFTMANLDAEGLEFSLIGSQDGDKWYANSRRALKML